MATLQAPRIESDVLKALNFQDDCLDIVTMAVRVTTEVGNSRSFEFKAVFISDKAWDVVPAEFHEGYVLFPLRPTKHIVIISTEKWELQQLNRDGFVYKSVDFKDLTVTFPPDSVSKECEIEIQVLSPNEIELLEEQDGGTFTDIVIASPRLWIKHNEMLTLQKPVVVTLPLLSPTNTESELCLFKWTENDEVYLSETNLIVKNSIYEFTVNSFSGYVLCVLNLCEHVFFSHEFHIISTCSILGSAYFHDYFMV
ncbi:hypothetical protein CHS0354_038966 [Potamilus streckersoni]|uniref:Uncharacterized protein n=1 Tax=Potamilus streckersoni TaxID=2493646 RepID=A0AAE0VNI0_9BIVA|nr:hypothetical protein CHS0354_038966 [Potamilus streckersoni]